MLKRLFWKDDERTSLGRFFDVHSNELEKLRKCPCKKCEDEKKSRNDFADFLECFWKLHGKKDKETIAQHAYTIRELRK